MNKFTIWLANTSINANQTLFNVNVKQKKSVGLRFAQLEWQTISSDYETLQEKKKSLINFGG